MAGAFGGKQAPPFGGKTGSAPAKAKARTAPPGKPPFGKAKGSGGLAQPKAPGPKAKKPPITGPMSGMRGGLGF